jgi:alpha-mannosidase
MQSAKLLLFSAFFFFLLFFQSWATAQTNITQLSGGTITSQYDDSPSAEKDVNLIDNSTTTKYLTFHSSSWVMFKSAKAYIVKKYAISSANDSPERDPASWTLEASNDGTSWTSLDSRKGQSFAARFQRNEFAITNTTAYSYYKLTATCASGTILQYSEFELLMDALSHDVGITGGSIPFTHPITAITPKIIVKNFGSNTETFPVTCKISLDGTEVYNHTVTVSDLTANSANTVSFPEWTPTSDVTYQVIVYTSLDGDLLKYNDTLSFTANTKKKMYMVGYAHLDLQWNWDLGTTVRVYIPNTLESNFPLFDKYPLYKFTFEGAYRYMLMKKKYPADYAKLKTYIASGQWNVGGSMVEACDVNMPSPESLFRQILYGNNFFNEEFGKTCVDILLPDCFGFPYTLPTIAAHSGLKGFSTQKFDIWGGFRSTPFSIGKWQGVDGSTLIAVLKPGPYSDDPQIRPADVNALGAKTGLYWGYDYYGAGDMGGAPSEKQVTTLMGMVNDAKSDITAVPASSDQIFRDITDAQASKLDTYNGELLMTQHGTGCYTAQANMKTLNRQNELMGGSAERASVMAELFTNTAYPKETIKQDWINFLCHQFHDDLTGTSIPSAYANYSLPDEKASLASFTKIRDDANTAIAGKLNTQVADQSTTVPVVVYNPIASSRADVSQATVTFSGAVPKYIKVYNKDGNEVPSQIQSVSEQTLTVLFLATVPGNSYSVFQVTKSDTPCALATGLSVSKDYLENKKYKVKVDDFGDIVSVFDKQLGKELLGSSSTFDVHNDKSQTWPAWEVLYSDVTASPRSKVNSSVVKTVADTGAAQVSIKVTRENEGSSFTHYYILTADSISFVKVDNTVDWKSTNSNGSLLKVSFPLTASNSKTTYDLGLGVIARGLDAANLYEVPGHQWADISNPDNSYGVAVLNNCKYGWNKPANNIINLTLIHTPNGTSYNYKGDLYVHNFTYAIYGHAGSWADGNVVNAGERLNLPLVAYQATSHADGGLGKSFSFVSSDPSQIAVMAVKKAEYGDQYIIRVREAAGKTWQNVQLHFPGTVVSAKEVNGMEQDKGAVSYDSKSVTFDIGPYQPKTFSIQFSNNISDVKDTKTLLSLYDLSQNNPNPFNPSTVITYTIPVGGLVSLKVYDVLGKEVASLVNESQNAGKHSVQFNASHFASGIYFYTLKAGSFSLTKKMTLVK